MWFDVQAALAEIEGGDIPAPEARPPAIPAKTAIPSARLAEIAEIAAPRPAKSEPVMTPEELARELYEERAAIREYDGGQDRAEAEAAAWQEAMRAAGITALDEWKQGSDGNRHGQRSRKMEGGKR